MFVRFVPSVKTAEGPEQAILQLTANGKSDST